MSSAEMARVVRYVRMDSRDDSSAEDEGRGRFRGNRMPVRGIFHSASYSLALVV